MRDMAVMMAYDWFEAGAPPGRPKLREAVVDLWQSRGYPGLSDPAHVTARAASGRRFRDAAGDMAQMIFKGAGTTRHRVGPGAGVVLVPDASMAGGPDGVHIRGMVWTWTYGDEVAEEYNAEGTL